MFENMGDAIRTRGKCAEREREEIFCVVIGNVHDRRAAGLMDKLAQRALELFKRDDLAYDKISVTFSWRRKELGVRIHVLLKKGLYYSF